MSQYESLKKQAESVFGAKGKVVSQTAKLKLAIVKRAEVFPTDSNLGSARKAAAYLQNVIFPQIAESAPLKQESAIVDGERFLSEESLQNRAGGYVLKVRDIARLRRDTERKIAALTTDLQNIEAKIPHAQLDSFRAVLLQAEEAFREIPL